MSFKMVTRYAHSPKDIQHYDTDELRQEFLMDKIFSLGDILLTYTYNDRMIFGGVTPKAGEPLEIKLDKELGVDFFLQRRELGFINIGGSGSVTIDGKKDTIVTHDGYYIGMGAKHVVFESDDSDNPAKFYVVSTPAHKTYPNKKLPFKDAIAMPMGDQKNMNKRTIYKYIDASSMDTCQLQMGYTVLEPGNSWNTMPCHTHARRMETYMYCEFGADDTRVFHFMGKPDESKHIVMEPEQAVVNPSWSIHCGVGTTNYAFIWAMCGENQTYDDMDMVDMHDLK
ncbi:5-dehydro-4-deoxy-D-glucuronate isomerase [Limosilactobacillus caccae]|uniref:5-dehydro-4-deoxy-D-glucuronate isomerase n=1 Tax=Limosilactobacillus caccae TaxID=1926284 RepID=UPI000970CFC3|nr:5-dehydro-4-deoxy-D-glucuronate isomerase [Limosilactobacillus caccae]